MNCFLILLNFSVGYIIAHVQVKYPAPRRSIFSFNYISAKDINYNNDAPISPTEFVSNLYSGSICRGKKGPIEEEYTAGDIVKFELIGVDIHGGGHCEFSLSLDGKVFISIKTILGQCLRDQSAKTYYIKLPDNLPASQYVLAWSWINKIGNREFYLNCIDIKVTEKQILNPKYLQGPQMFLGNLPGYPTIPEFYFDDFGKEYYDNREIIRAFKGVNQHNDLIVYQKMPKSPEATKTEDYNYSNPTKLPEKNPQPKQSSHKEITLKCLSDKRLQLCFGDNCIEYDCLANSRCMQNSLSRPHCQ